MVKELCSLLIEFLKRSKWTVANLAECRSLTQAIFGILFRLRPIPCILSKLYAYSCHVDLPVCNKLGKNPLRTVPLLHAWLKCMSV